MQSVLHSVAQSNDKPIQLHVIISFFFSGHAYVSNCAPLRNQPPLGAVRNREWKERRDKKKKKKICIRKKIAINFFPVSINNKC